MHEYSVVAQLVNALLPQIENVKGQILEVHLHKGQLRILSDEALKNAFELITAGTRLEGASLRIEPVPAEVHCDRCGFRGAPELLEDPAFHFAIPVLSCPRCGSEVDLSSGRELYVDTVSVEDPANDAPPSEGDG